MGTATTTLRATLQAAAFAGAPALMFLGYHSFGAASAANMGVHDLASDYAEGVMAALILLGLILLSPLPAPHRRALALLWMVRMGVTLGAMLAIEARYRGDAWGFYVVGTWLSDPLAYFSFGEGTRNTQALVGLLAYASDAYSAIKVVFSFVGLTAIYILYRAATVALGHERIVLLYALGLFPSLLLWSSLLGKEPVTLLGIAIYAYGVVRLLVERRMLPLVYVAIGLIIAASIRIWLGGVFVAPLLFAYVMSSRTAPAAKLAFIFLAVPAFLLAMQGFAERFRVESAEDLVATTDYLSQSWARGGSAQRIAGGFGSFTDMIAFLPVGTFTALFRPLPLEVRNPFGLLAGLENAFLLGLLLLGLFRRGLRPFGHPVLLWAAATLLVWGAVYGFVSYQNLGTAFRWRSQTTPILLFLGLYLVYAHHLRDAAQRPLRRPPPVPETASGAARPQEQP